MTNKQEQRQVHSTGNSDFWDGKTVAAFHNAKLVELLRYLHENSRFYGNLFKVCNIEVSKIKTTEDLKYLPTTTKRDIQLYNDDFLCVSKDRIVEYTATSGTLGTPVVVALSDSDLRRLAYNEYLSFAKMNLANNDVIQLALTLDKQFMAGMAYYQGSRMLGAAVVRTGPGVAAMQWDTIFRLGSTTLVAVPSFIVKLLEYAEYNGIDHNHSCVKQILCIGENIRNIDMQPNLIGRKIMSKWDVDLYSTYASSEMQTAFTECGAGAGGHQNRELIIVELLDECGNKVEPGEIGELTVTLLGVEAMPLLRYRTGDLCRMIVEPCSCGRTSPRISPIVGRKDQMVKFKGTTMYPPAIFEILNARDEIEDYVVEVTSNDLGTDNLTIHLSFKRETDIGMITSCLHSSLRVRPDIKICDLTTLRNMQSSEASRKVTRFLDKRQD